jgi:hypothetical protein
MSYALSEFQIESSRGNFPWRHSAWYKHENFQVYLRLDSKSVPLVGRINTFTLANISSDILGSGKFRGFILKLEKIAKTRGVKWFWVENIHNEKLPHVFSELGFNIVKYDMGDIHAYKRMT